MNDRLIIRWGLFIVGIIVLTFGARVILLSTLGVSGLDAVAIGLAEWTGSSIGTMIIILGIILTCIGNIINSHINFLPITISLLIGGLYDIWGNILFNQINSPTYALYKGWIFLIGIFIAPMGAALYILSHFSVGPVDFIMLSIRRKYNYSIQISRTLLEGIFVITGWLLGGPIGVGTICIMFLWGPILQIYLNWIEGILEKHIK